MKIRNSVLACTALLSILAGVGCTRVQAKAALKDGNKLYKEENFKKAIEEYERAVELAPDMPEAHFYLASSFQALFRPGKDDAENIARLDKAIEHYQKALELNPSPTSPNQKKLRTNTLAALTGIYSEPPKQNFDEAFKYGKQLVDEAPNDTRNLYAMANLYEKFGKIEEAEATYKKIADMNPGDVKACGALAAFYNKPLWDKKSRFDEAITVMERCAALNPNDGSGYYKIATFFWDKAYRDPLLNDTQKNEYAEKGLEQVDKALQIKPDYWEAIITKGLLYRVKASVAKNPKERQQYLEQAATLQKHALDLRKEQQASASPEPGAAPEAPPTEGETPPPQQ
jgi:tetratricopeptide (TPR) repeat protein